MLARDLQNRAEKRGLLSLALSGCCTNIIRPSEAKEGRQRKIRHREEKGQRMCAIFASLGPHYIRRRTVSHIKQDDIISQSDSCIAGVGYSLSTSRSAAFLFVCVIPVYSYFSIGLNIQQKKGPTFGRRNGCHWFQSSYISKNNKPLLIARHC